MKLDNRIAAFIAIGLPDTPAAGLSTDGGKLMLNTIQRTSESDSQLAKLLAEAREFAQIYVLSSQRQKGCDGMGELATIKEEFREVIDKMIQYCKEKKCISQDVAYDIDSIADELKRS